MKPIIALDADGVLLNYHLAYAQAWSKAFGSAPTVRDPLTYWPIDRWDVRRLVGDELAQFRGCFDHHYWSTIPAIPGAVDACHALVTAGYEPVMQPIKTLVFEHSSSIMKIIKETRRTLPMVIQ